jgi:hypothetical protein
VEAAAPPTSVNLPAISSKQLKGAELCGSPAAHRTATFCQRAWHRLCDG